jgi:predicted amidohydrolase
MSKSSSDSLPTDTVRIAGIVLKWVRANRELNYRRIEPMIREAAANGAQIVVTSECFLDGYAVRDKEMPVEQYFALGEPIPGGEYFQKLAGLARELGIYLAIGVHEACGQTHYNTAALIGPDGQLVGKYHKHKLGHEIDRHVPAPEGAFPAFPTRYGTVGMLICADRSRPDIFQGLCANGADFIFCLSGGAFGPEKNDPAMQARSRDIARYIIFVHPAQFLVTAPDGAIRDTQMLGDPARARETTVVREDEIGGERDRNRVCYFDLPLGEFNAR